MTLFPRLAVRISVVVTLLLALSACMKITIGGILAAIAIPAYQDYTIRAQVNEGVMDTRSVQLLLAQDYARAGEFPPQPGSLETQYNTARVVDGNIVLTYGNHANDLIAGGVLVLTPYMDPYTNEMNWACGYAAQNRGYETLVEPMDTTMDPKYLPSTCR